MSEILEVRVAAGTPGIGPFTYVIPESLGQVWIDSVMWEYSNNGLLNVVRPTMTVHSKNLVQVWAVPGISIPASSQHRMNFQRGGHHRDGLTELFGDSVLRLPSIPCEGGDVLTWEGDGADPADTVTITLRYRPILPVVTPARGARR